jgi:heptosyltransferase-2
MSKVLIIKIGWVEVLDNRFEDSISLGDVFRCTSLLHLYKNDFVTWVTDQTALPLLSDIKYIKRLLPYNLNTVLQLQKEYFDIVINLEKVAGVCALADSINAWKKFGFRLNPITGDVEAYHGAQSILDISKNQKTKKGLDKTFQDFLFELVGAKWNKEEYILGYTPKTKEVYDIGLNHIIGAKWPTKQWGDNNWKKLEEILKRKWTVSWQKGLNNIEEYIDWINSCRLIITNDSLGLHLALALKKKVVAIFGPTFSNEIYMYERGTKILPPIKRDCIPCMKPVCKYKKRCIEYITVDSVVKEVENLLS